MDESWKSDLERWLTPFLGALRHKVRVRMCPAYVAGLIGAGDDPIAAGRQLAAKRSGPADHLCAEPGDKEDRLSRVLAKAVIGQGNAIGRHAGGRAFCAHIRVACNWSAQ